MGYKKDVIKGISWLSFFRISTRAISFLRTAIIARILTPQQFGIYGIATIVLAFIEMLTETGINIFLIQKKDEIDKYIDTAWVTSILRGILISLVIFISAPFIAGFYNSDEVIALLFLAGIVPLLRGFINPSIAKFIKDLNFRTEFVYRTSVFIVESIVSLIIVYLFKSPIGLIIGLIAGALFEVIFSFILVKPLPHFKFKMPLFKEVINKNKWFTGAGVLSYMYNHGDDAVVGKILGTGSLGLYDMAYRSSILPITEVSDVIVKATFPVYVKIGDDIERVKKAYLKSVALISVIVIPVGVFVFLFPSEIISLILGSQWLEAAPVLQVLTIFGVVQAISSSIVAPLYAYEKQNMVIFLSLTNLLGMALTIVPFISIFGLVGAGYSVLCGAILALPVSFYFLKSIFKK